MSPEAARSGSLYCAHGAAYRPWFPPRIRIIGQKRSGAVSEIEEEGRRADAVLSLSILHHPSQARFGNPGELRKYQDYILRGFIIIMTYRNKVMLYMNTPRRRLISKGVSFPGDSGVHRGRFCGRRFGAGLLGRNGLNNPLSNKGFRDPGTGPQF